MRLDVDTAPGVWTCLVPTHGSWGVHMPGAHTLLLGCGHAWMMNIDEERTGRVGLMTSALDAVDDEL
jgi:hypothetical protein